MDYVLDEHPLRDHANTMQTKQTEAVYGELPRKGLRQSPLHYFLCPLHISNDLPDTAASIPEVN